MNCTTDGVRSQRKLSELTVSFPSSVAFDNGRMMDEGVKGTVKIYEDRDPCSDNRARSIYLSKLLN